MKPASPAAKTAYYIGPLLLWMLVIFGFSTDVASGEKTRPAVRGIVARLFPGLARQLSPAMLRRIDFNIRKTAHICEYALLAILAYRAVAFGNPNFRSRHVLIPFLIGVLYAASDEYHQSLTPSREGRAADVTFDTFGVTVGLLFCLWQHGIAASRRAAEEPSESLPAAPLVPSPERSTVP